MPGGNQVEVAAHHAEVRDEGRGVEEHAAAVLQDGAKEVCGVKSQLLPEAVLMTDRLNGLFLTFAREIFPKWPEHWV